MRIRLVIWLGGGGRAQNAPFWRPRFSRVRYVQLAGEHEEDPQLA